MCVSAVCSGAQPASMLSAAHLKRSGELAPPAPFFLACQWPRRWWASWCRWRHMPRTVPECPSGRDAWCPGCSLLCCPNCPCTPQACQGVRQRSGAAPTVAHGSQLHSLLGRHCQQRRSDSRHQFHMWLMLRSVLICCVALVTARQGVGTVTRISLPVSHTRSHGSCFGLHPPLLTPPLSSGA